MKFPEADTGNPARVMGILEYANRTLAQFRGMFCAMPEFREAVTMQFGENFPETSDTNTLIDKFWSDEPALASTDPNKRRRTVELGVLANNFAVSYCGPQNPDMAQETQLNIVHFPAYQLSDYRTIKVQTGSRPRVAFNMPDPGNISGGPGVVRRELSAVQHDISPYLKAFVRKLLA